MSKFAKICKDIKEIKIQGARNIAQSALLAYSLNPTKKAKKKLLSLRPTEPMLINVLGLVEKKSKEEILSHFSEAQIKINKFTINVIKDNSTILTHCHSTNVINALIYAKKHGKNFKIINTETRPLFQGRQTSTELSKARINVTMITDSAAGDALEEGGEIKKVNTLFIGSDAILKNGDVINKIGSNMFAEIANNNKVPVYVIADAWKFSNRKIEIEEREHHELWNIKSKKIKIKNPAFETVKSKYITAIISELGILKPKEFIKKVKKAYPWIK